MPSNSPLRLRVLPGSIPSRLSLVQPAGQPASPDQPWVIGLVEAFDVERGERRPVDLSRVTETWLRDRLGDRADQALSLFSHVRPRISEAVFAYMLTGMAAELIYNE